MGHKILISYKFNDSDVKHIQGSLYERNTVRDYVNEIQDRMSASDHIYKAESDDEDLSGYSDSTIWEKLKLRIYDSTITIVMISPGMRISSRADRDQWIPQEVSYSLKGISRKDKNGNAITSRTNALLKIVLPDRNGSYTYFTSEQTCCTRGCIQYNTSNLFDILRKNMFQYKTAR